MTGPYDQSKSAGPSASSPPCLGAALSYLRRGWSVIPVGKDKRPTIPWQPLQHGLPTGEQVRGWFQRCPAACVGIVLGTISGLCAVDFDPRNKGDLTLAEWEGQGWHLPDNGPQCKTGGGGLHIYLALPAGGLPTVPGIGQGIDLKAEGSYVVAPPSVHPSGGRYQWYPGNGPELPLPAVPAFILTLVKEHKAPESVTGEGPREKAWQLLNGRILEGGRNDALTRIGGWLRRYHPAPVVQALLLAINDGRCVPPLDEEDVREIAHSLGRYPTPGAPGHPLAIVPSYKRETSE
jgi:hypothetical protein